MSQTSAWQVDRDPDVAAVYEVLSRDRIWNSFAIADLVPPFREYSEHIVARRGPSEAAALLILRHPAVTVLSPYGLAAGVEAILERADLPEGGFAQVMDEHRSVIQRVYAWTVEPERLLRMTVDSRSVQAPMATMAETPEQLGPANLKEVQALYRLFPGNTVNHDQMRDGVFYGVRVAGELMAIGGTHAVAIAYGIAVLGGIFTHPAMRGRGYASAITAALVNDLFDRECRDVVLNVIAANEPAIRVYERLGFRTHKDYWNGKVRRLDTPAEPYDLLFGE